MTKRKVYWPTDDPDSVVCAWAETASGPGWSNAPLWAIIRHTDGSLEMVVIQPDEQTTEMHAIYAISNVVSGMMLKAVRAWMFRTGRDKGRK